MTARKDFKKLIRNRIRRTGEPYSAARRHFLSAEEQEMTQSNNAPYAGDTPVAELQLTLRTTRILKAQGIETLGALRALNDRARKNLNLSPEGELEVREVLASRGW